MKRFFSSGRLFNVKMTDFLVAQVNDLKDGQMKEVSLGAGKALLYKLNGSFHATSHLVISNLEIVMSSVHIIKPHL